jgi:hypothetical protein
VIFCFVAGETLRGAKSKKCEFFHPVPLKWFLKKKNVKKKNNETPVDAECEERNKKKTSGV